MTELAACTLSIPKQMYRIISALTTLMQNRGINSGSGCLGAWPYKGG